MSLAEISVMIDRGKTVLLAYIEIARQDHPDLFSEAQYDAVQDEVLKTKAPALIESAEDLK